MSQFEKIWKRLWSQTKVMGEDECWEWFGNRNSDGYGRIWVYERLESAHRMSWRFLKGNIPANACVLHSCDNPPCVNPAHLFLGTQQDNANDRETKGRGNQSIGEKNGNSKLISKDVLKIRAIYSDGLTSQRKLAKMFKISKSTVGYMLSRSNWKHI